MTDEIDIEKRLGPDASLAAENVRAVQESLRLFIDKNRLTQRRVAELLGVSGAMVHQFLSAKGYKGDTKKLCDKIIYLIANVERRARQGHAGRFVETSVAKRIATFISQCDAFSVGEGKIGLIVGDGGHGKSVCLQQYAGANRNAIYILLDDTMRSRGIFKEIALALKVNCYGVTSDVTARIVASLRCRNVVIILDEASGLSVEQLNSLRQIVAVKGRSPLVLAGNRQLLNTVLERTARREAASLEQFTSRLVGVLNLDEIGADRGGGLYTAEDIRKLYEYDGIRLTADGVTLLRSICRTGKSGRLRTCSVIITALHTSEAAEIDGRLIIAAIEQLDLPVRAWLPVATRDIGAEEQVTAAVRTA